MKTSPTSVRHNIDAKRCTTFFIGGVFETLYEPSTLDELSVLLRQFHNEGTSWRILGAGSNLLVEDRKFSEPVIRLGRGFREIEPLSEHRFWIGGAASLMTLSRDFSERGLSGLEFAGGIPASLGGAVRMNAGAHGGEIKDVLQAVRYVTPTGEIEEVKASDLSFSYRHNSLRTDAVITHALICFTPGDPTIVAAKRAENLAERKKRQPLTAPSAGSVFRNPSPGETAGMLIERAGLKGEKIGGAEISELHANWIINPERKAKFSDVSALIEKCRAVVAEKYKVELHPEVVRWG